MHASTLICLALSFVGAFAQGPNSNTDKGIITPTIPPLGPTSSSTSSSIPSSSSSSTSTESSSTPTSTSTSTSTRTTSTATSTPTKQEEQPTTTSSSSSTTTSSSSSAQDSATSTSAEAKTADTLSSTSSSALSSSTSSSSTGASTKATSTSASSTGTKSTSTNAANNANANTNSFVTNRPSATNHDVAGPVSTWTDGSSDDDSSNNNAPTGFLANKGAVAGTSIVAALAGIVGIWMLVSFINRRRRRAAREAYRSDFQDMSTYEKKPEHNDVEMAPAASRDHADASFGDVAHSDMDHAAVTAPANAYPDREVHYGYEQSGAYAYNNQGAQAYHNQGAYGQDYNAYGQGIVDLPPNQAGYAAYGAHPQQDPYGGYTMNPYGGAAGYNQGYPQQQHGAYGHAQ